MNLATLTINKRFFASFLTTLLCILGIYGYFALGKLEDPTFTVKTAAVVTFYPGASAEEVEQRVTDVIERKVEEMGTLWKLRSVSRPGQSTVYVHLYDTVPLDQLQQQWDLLRRKINDVQLELPLEAQAHVVADEFSEVYGMLFALRGEGIPARELNHYARMLQRDLKAVDGINKVITHGLHQRQIVIEIDQAKLAKVNLTPLQLFDQLQSQNLVNHPGEISANQERIRIANDDTLGSVEAVSDLILRGGGANVGGDRFRLADVATVREVDVEHPSLQTRFNGHSTITVAVNPQDGINVVAIGDDIKQAIADFEAKVPTGVVVDTIVFQPDEVDKSVTDFTGNLISSVAIVVVVLWLFMGWRSASIVGGSLAITLLLTLVYMMVAQINLHRVSVGTFILALGMLVDNAIVVTDLFIAKLRSGIDRGKAAADTIKETATPLLAATLIAIAATSPVLFSKTAAAEFAIDLPIIMFASLMLSWVVAMTITPLMCWQFYRVDSNNLGEPKWMGSARRTVTWIVTNRKTALTGVLVAIGITAMAATQVLLNFMPGSDRPITFVDYWLPQGGNVQQTAADMAEIEQWLLAQPEVESVASFIGGGAPRFTMTYEPEPNDPAYGQLLVNVGNYEQIPELRRRGDAWLKQQFPMAEPRFRPLKLATQDKFNLEARFLGPDPVVLSQLASQAKAIFAAHPNTKYIRDDWRQPSKVLVPQFNQDRARLAGITRNDVNRALARATDGLLVASIYDGRDRLPVRLQLEQAQRNDFSALMNLPVTPALGTKSVPMSQVVDGFELRHEPGQIWRYYRQRTMSVQADVEGQYASLVRKDIAAEVEAIALPEGYRFEWGGEYYDEARTVQDVIDQLPKAGVIMLLLMVAMFNGLRQPLAIIMTIPLAIVGIVPMLIAAGKPFGFMALVGVISLSGMIIKNGIVLMDQINLEMANGRTPFDAIVESAVNRTLAISMAALTTVLGMIPLWWDPLFGPMAVTIIGGLTVATFLTLLIMPVFYALLFRVENPKEASDA